MAERRFPLVEWYDPKAKRTVWRETHPESCPSGHPWTTPGSFRNGHRPCAEHNGHRVWSCATKGCDSEPIVDPVPDETCTGPTGGPRF